MNMSFEAYIYMQDQGASITITIFKLLQKPGEL